MKTQLAPICDQLAAVLGHENSQNSYISISSPGTPPTRSSAFVIEPTSTLARIYAALDRLEQGTFGLCTQCGDQISLGRLEDDPSIPLCQVCEAYRDL